ncbi:AAA family ATPase [Rhizobium leguminosarum]|uniref:AAA family ATPase n=1 Tax=Rhizobium leguminosarum TaxID=384 RepID=UPI001C937189|nr:AAA family ATPase [Rhizobium leguminosarum]MBY5349583.1 AAA family ATPase [Rhizobium leguminosarum]
MTAPQRKEFIEAEDMRHAWSEFKEFCWMLSGDAVLMPFKDGEPDWQSATRDSLQKINHWSDFTAADIPRLAILTDSFDRFIGKGADASVVTLWREGTPIIQQIDGEPCDRAVDAIREAIADDLPLEDVCGLPLADKTAGPQDPPVASTSTPANDNLSPERAIRLRRIQADHGGEIRGSTLFGAKFDGVPGQVFFVNNEMRFVSGRGVYAPVVEREQLHATPFSLGDPSAIPERDWLFGRHFIRKYATASVGPGGGGKTAHSISEALAMVTGRPLLDPDGPLTKPLRVWWINAEDPQDEIARRFHGAAKHFGVTNEQVGGRLFTDSGRDQQFVIARQEGRDIKIVEPFIDDMVAEISRREIDVVIIDPFVSTHEAPENDNGAMQRVTAAWVRVADEANCGVELVHHVAKNQGEVTADSARGGGAFKDKVRSMRVFNVMTQAEAEKAGVDDPRAYFRVDFGKVNMVSSGHSQWRRFVSVPLMNGRGLTKSGDEIGVVEPWKWPSADAIAERAASARAAVVADVPAETLAGIKVRLEASDHKADHRAKHWAGNLLIELGIASDKDRAKAMLAAWIDAGELEIVRMKDASRHEADFIKPVAGV